MAQLNPGNPVKEQVLVQVHSPFVRTLVLNRPKQLNALSYHMIYRLTELFLAYEKDPSIKLIILKGSGRAFCAGGDISVLVESHIEGNWKFAANYFRKEYSLNYVIETCRIPQVSVINGVVMGGGAGVSIHGRFRVVTENAVFAMPETALGHFTDVGASYFLPRLPRFFGEYLGLTGTRLDGAEMLACGLATHFVRSKKLQLLEEELYKANSNDLENISEILEKFSEQPVVKENSAYHQLHIVDRCFSCRTVEEILSALEKEAATNSAVWIPAAIQSLRRASPTSLKLSLRLIREGRSQGIGECLIREYRIASHHLRGHVNRDFIEGYRAILVDKDRNPKWEPSRLDLVTDSMVDYYFTRVNDEEWEDLKFPARSNLPVSAMAKL